MIRDIDEYRQALQSIDRRLDWIIDDAESLDRLLLDPAFGEEGLAGELASERRMRNVLDTVNCMGRAINTMKELARECKDFEDNIFKEAR